VRPVAGVNVLIVMECDTVSLWKKIIVSGSEDSSDTPSQYKCESCSKMLHAYLAKAGITLDDNASLHLARICESFA